MGIKGAKTIAEYEMFRWAVAQGFVMEHFTLTVVLVYDRETKTVHVEGE